MSLPEIPRTDGTNLKKKTQHPQQQQKEKKMNYLGFKIQFFAGRKHTHIYMSCLNVSVKKYIYALCWHLSRWGSKSVAKIKHKLLTYMSQLLANYHPNGALRRMLNQVGTTKDSRSTEKRSCLTKSVEGHLSKLYAIGSLPLLILLCSTLGEGTL